MNRAALIPPLALEDNLPHDRAVWRKDYTPTPREIEAGIQVSVDYGDGAIERTSADMVDWSRVRRWRFGWSPQ
jgi:hypothetical protein